VQWLLRRTLSFLLDFVVLTLVFTTLILVLEIFTSYAVYARILKWLALSLLAYPITMLIVHEPWMELLKATFIPHIEFRFAFLFIITGVIGTTISPYMFFWEASEEVEEEELRGIKTKDGKPMVNKGDLQIMRIDNFIGMLSSNLISWCIIVTAGTVLHKHGVTNIATSADAAKALQPLVNTFPNSGFLAEFIFSVGVVGLGLLAVPVLSGSASYAVAEAVNWEKGLNLKLKRAHGFYGVITLATLVGLLINFVGIDPIKALVLTAVINGVVAVPLIYLIARIANNRQIMGEFKSGIISNVFVWLTFIFMGATAVAMFATL
jgi:Mn2+/Fe2+ NRAMP family transporter